METVETAHDRDHDPSAAQVEAAAGRPRPIWRELGVVVLVAVALVVVLARPFPLDSPVVYRGDTFQHLALIEAADWTGSVDRSEHLAAPHGHDWSVFPTGTERLHLVVLNAFDELTGDAVAAMNLHVLLMLVASAVVGHVVLRWLGCRPIVAGAVALLVAFSPAATQRLAAGHLFLFALYPVALGVYLTVWAVRVPPPRTWSPAGWRAERWLPRRDWALPIVAAVAVALSSAYYTVFTAVLVAGVGVLAAVRRGNTRQLVAPLVLVVVLVGVAAASLAPDLLDRRNDPAAQSLARPVSDSDSYGLRVAQMVLPRPDHPIEPLADWGERAFRTRAPGDRGVALGFAGTLGLAALAVAVVRRSARPRDDTDRTLLTLGACAATALVTATTGGAGFVLATLGLTQVRAWSRMAPFLLFCALAALGLFVQRLAGHRERFAAWVVLVALVALVDQGAWRADRSAQDAASREDSETVQQIVEQYGTGTFVVQLPAVTFPDDIGADRLLAPAHHAEGRLRVSAGAFRGGPGDWQESWLLDDPADAARAAAAAGAELVLVQRTHGLVEDPDQFDRRLAAATGQPARVSDGGTWSWFDLRPLRERLVAEHGEQEVRRAGRGVVRPIGVTYDGSAGRVYDDGHAATLLGPDGALVVHDRSGQNGPVAVQLRLVAAPGAEVVVRAGGDTHRLEPGDDGASLRVEVPIRQGQGRVTISTDGAPLPVQGSDGAALVRLSDVRVHDPAAARSPVLR